MLKLNVVPFEGGTTLTLNGHIVGAIGVSGVTAEQDGQAVQAGVDWFTANVKASK